MKLSCRLRWHEWGRWTWVPVTKDPSNKWAGGQIRYCVNCNFAEVKTFENQLIGVEFVKPQSQCIEETNG